MKLVEVKDMSGAVKGSFPLAEFVGAKLGHPVQGEGALIIQLKGGRTLTIEDGSLEELNKQIRQLSAKTVGGVGTAVRR